MKENMSFRKYLQEHGVSYEEFETMSEVKQQEILKAFKIQNRGNNIQDIGEAMQGCGCMIILIPIAIVLIMFIWGVITS